MWRGRCQTDHDSNPKSLGRTGSAQRLEKCDRDADLEEEEQQKGPQYLLNSRVGKLYTKILEQRARAKAEYYFSNAQFSFRKGRGCTDAVFALRQLCERAVEYDRALQLVFVDQEKAFDRVDREKLWGVLEQYNIKGQLLDNIKALYAGSKSAVRTPSGLTNWFSVKSGVRQGCVLSPLLFIIYMDRITKESNPEPGALNELLFADDQVILYESNIALQQHTEGFNRVCK